MLCFFFKRLQLLCCVVTSVWSEKHWIAFQGLHVPPKLLFMYNQISRIGISRIKEVLFVFSLSGLGLKTQDLPVRLLSRLRSLERWDLSGNSLQALPKSLELPALCYLDLSDNQMEDVTTLEPLSGLQELKMEDNLYITVRMWRMGFIC